MDLGLNGRRALVTGGAGGIGSAVVRSLAAEGAQVAVHYRTSGERARQLADDVDGVAVGGDLTDEDAVGEVFDTTRGELGGLDICVANAGMWPREDVAVADMSLDRWRATIETNLTLTFLTARGFLGGLDDDLDQPSLVLIASTAGVFGEAGHADYAAAKSAMAGGLLLSLKNEIVRTHPAGRVNAVAPGWTVSPMTERDLDDTIVEQATATMSLSKVARPEDIASTVCWVASPAAGHVTGEVITVAGGMEGRLLRPPS